MLQQVILPLFSSKCKPSTRWIFIAISGMLNTVETAEGVSTESFNPQRCSSFKLPKVDNARALRGKPEQASRILATEGWPLVPARSDLSPWSCLLLWTSVSCSFGSHSAWFHVLPCSHQVQALKLILFCTLHCMCQIEGMLAWNILVFGLLVPTQLVYWTVYYYTISILNCILHYYTNSILNWIILHN